jgi:hypothetical protein
MKRKNLDPYRYSLEHCKKRARERYDFELFDGEYDILTQWIKDDLVASLFPKATTQFLRINQEGAQVTMVVPFENTQFVCVFDMDSGLLKTLLPPEQFSEFLD